MGLAGLGMAWLLAPTSAVAPGTPQVIPADAFHRVEVATPVPAIVDSFPRPTRGPRPDVEVPAAQPIVEGVPPPRPPECTTACEGGPSTSGTPTVAEAKAYALSRLGATQFSCFDQLMEKESGWRVHATNSSSGAYGIPQALPGSKMAVIADDWRDNPITQVRWGIRYVNGRYGSACAAWGSWLDNRWY